MTAILDTEVGGWSITKNGICEIGLIIADNNLKPLEERNWIIRPYTRPDSEELVSYKEDAMKVTGISMKDIESGQEVSEVMRDLHTLFCDYDIETIVGHNLKTFDLPRLEYLAYRFLGLTFMKLHHVDTLELCRKHLNLDCNKLESLCKHFDITNKNPHRALGDCGVTLEVYKQFMAK